MDEMKKTSTEGTQTGAEGTQAERTFTQEDVNRIVQERLAKEKSRSTGNSGDELDKRAADLDLRERKLTAREKLQENGLPDYLVDALNMNTDEDFQKSLEAILKMRGEAESSAGQEHAGPGSYIGPKPVGFVSPIGKIQSMGNRDGDSIRTAFGLR